MAIDNCFASKRWTRPSDWVRIIKELGVGYVEASADNECDPLYADPGYLKNWLREVESACERTGVKVSSLYSGHGTYATVGLASRDGRNQERIHNLWAKVMIHHAARLRAGLGFFCHAFDEETLQDPSAYAAAEDGLYRRLAELAEYAGAQQAQFIAVEQMVRPTRFPGHWQEPEKFLSEIWARNRSLLFDPRYRPPIWTA